METLSLPFGATLGIERPPTELRHAERLFRRALDVNPGLTEARIRQGNVLGLLGRHKDAVKELERALSEAADDTLLSYYASMFLGREADALGDAVNARASYQKALGLYNRAQSPRVALSALAKRVGNHDESRDIIDLLLSRSRGGADDPWWRYSQEAGRFAESLMTAARKTFTARRPR
jgi:tetratricopeptide (TPR) repeat protein